MTVEASRSSERLKDKAKKDEELDEEEKKLEIETQLAPQGLPIDGSLEFRFSMDTSGTFNVRYKDLYRTADDTRLCTWSIEAFWKASDFYPGQIIKFTHAFAQSDPEAIYNEYLGEYASTIYGPVGMYHVLD
jgi:hypothetical protein